MMAVSQSIEAVPTVDFRQLRHQTKNALAKILAQVSIGLASPDACRRTVADVERRIMLTAQISDALFGLTREPGPFAHRLETLCESIVGLAAESDQYITLTCAVSAEPDAKQAETLLRVAHEFVSNAVKHGMHMRLLGRIEVSVEMADRGVMLQVSDDGWGCARTPSHGEGLGVASVLAERCDGRVSLQRVGERKVARLALPIVPHA